MIRFLIALALGLGPALADQQTPPLPPAPSLDAPAQANGAGQKGPGHAGVHGYGHERADCAEWSDGCVVCRRSGEQETACSTAGVACTPGDAVCRKAK